MSVVNAFLWSSIILTRWFDIFIIACQSIFVSAIYFSILSPNVKPKKSIDKDRDFQYIVNGFKFSESLWKVIDFILVIVHSEIILKLLFHSNYCGVMELKMYHVVFVCKYFITYYSYNEWKIHIFICFISYRPFS